MNSNLPYMLGVATVMGSIGYGLGRIKDRGALGAALGFLFGLIGLAILGIVLLVDARRSRRPGTAQTAFPSQPTTAGMPQAF